MNLRMRIVLFSFILIALVGCKSPKYTANTKAELSKLCVYEFPYSPKPIKIERDTIVLSNIQIVRDSIDCTDKEGVQYVEVKTPADTVRITEKIYLENEAERFYISSLELENENTKAKLEHAEKENKKLSKQGRRLFILLVLAITGGVYLIFKR